MKFSPDNVNAITWNAKKKAAYLQNYRFFYTILFVYNDNTAVVYFGV